MFDPNKFCHIASNARNRTKLACFLYKGKGAEWHQPGFFNPKATELNVDDFIFCYDENQTNVKRPLIEICQVTEKTTDTITVRSIEFAPAALLKVFHDETLLGDGTEDSPLKINPDAIVSEVIHDDTLLGNGTTEAPLGVNPENALYTTDTFVVGANKTVCLLKIPESEAGKRFCFLWVAPLSNSILHQISIDVFSSYAEWTLYSGTKIVGTTWAIKENGFYYFLIRPGLDGSDLIGTKGYLVDTKYGGQYFNIDTTTFITQQPTGVRRSPYLIGKSYYPLKDTDFVTPITTTNKGVTQEDIKGFITSIVHDDTLTGDGTTESPLGVNPAVGNVTLDTAQTITGQKTFAEQTIFTRSKLTGAISFQFQDSTSKRVAFAAGYAPLGDKAFTLSMLRPTANTLQYMLGSPWGGYLTWTEDGISVSATSTDKASRLGHGQLIASQMPSAANNYTWYRKYSDGWVEMGGTNRDSLTVTFPVPLESWAQPEYNVLYDNSGPAPYNDLGSIASINGTGFTKTGQAKAFVWCIVGKALN